MKVKFSYFFYIYSYFTCDSSNILLIFSDGLIIKSGKWNRSDWITLIGTSIPREQVLSTTDLSINAKRTILSPENVGKI
jgi:hypothetical protein